jgi:CSLREA domain-containing protein
LYLYNSTIAGNTSDNYGSGVYSSIGSSSTIYNSIVAGNTSVISGHIYTSYDVLMNGDISSLGNNMINTSDAQLTPLGWYGGSTQTMVPLAGSPAICAGAKKYALNGGAALTADQRGATLNSSCFAGSSYVDAGAVQTHYLLVNTLNDPATGSATVCLTGGTCSLRDALLAANASATGAAEIGFSFNGTIALTSALPLLTNTTSAVNLIGPGVRELTVSGGGKYRVFNIANAHAVVSLYGLTVAGGYVNGNGGAIYNIGTLTLNDSMVSGSSAIGSGYGGGIYSDSGALTLTDSTVSGNTSSSHGGGIYNSSGALTISNATISGNTSLDGGGVGTHYGELTVNNSTVSANSASDDGGGIYNLDGAVTLTNSVVSGNTASASYDNYFSNAGAYTSGGGNLVDSSSSNLSALGWHGGPTQTMVPLTGSAALGAGKFVTGEPAADQRGATRPSTSGAVIDSGAVQVTNPPMIASISPGYGPATGGTSVVITGTGLESASNVSFGGTAAASFTITSETNSEPAYLTAVSPAGSAGTVDITVTNSVGASATSSFDQFTYYAPLAISPATTLLHVTAGTSYSQSFTVNGGSGSYSFSSSTALPAGLTLTSNSTGWTLSGAPTQSGSFSFSLTVTDNVYPASLTVNYTLYVPNTATSLSMTITPSATAYGTPPTVLVTLTPSDATGIAASEFTATLNSTTALPVAAGSDANTFLVTLTSLPTAGLNTIAVNFTGSPDYIGSATSGSFTVTASFLVTNSGDSGSGPSDCLADTGTLCTLRDALSAADIAKGANITFSPLVFASATTITLGSSGTLSIPKDTTITGPASASGSSFINLVTVDGNKTYQVFNVSSSGATINHLIIANGHASGSNGGGIFNSGALTLNNSTVSGSSALSGGGIYNTGSGTMTVNNSNISGNKSTDPDGYGGGIYNVNSGSSTVTLTLDHSTVAGNFANSGGGIYSGAASTITVSNSTISGNTATLGGGAYSDDGGRLVLSNSTVSRNRSGSDGGGIYNGISGITLVRYSTISANTGGGYGRDVYEYVDAGCGTSGFLSLVDSIVDDLYSGGCDSSTGAYSDSGGNVLNSASKLSALGWYGGPTQTMPPLTGSPALNAGSFSSGYTPATDQRGVARPSTSKAKIDAGAVQMSGTVPVIASVTPAFGPFTGGTTVTIAGTGLDTVTNVAFGATAATSFAITAATSTAPAFITAVSPVVSTTGTVDITVTNSYGTSTTSSSDQFTYYAAPTISSVTPSYGPVAGGTSVTITGNNLSGVTAVKFSATAASSFSVNSDTQITAISPAGSAGTVDITVTNSYGTSATGSSDQFTHYTALTITPASTALSATYGASFSQTLTVSGGSGNYTLSNTSSLPPGLTLTPSGTAAGTSWTLSGTPTAIGSSYSLALTAADNSFTTFPSVTQNYTLTVNAAVTATQAVASATLTQNHAATSFTPVTGSGGTAPLSYSVSPSLPAGLSMSSATGTITGTPTVASASTNYTVTVTDASSTTATASFSLTVISAVTATQAVASATLTQNHAATSFTPVTGSGGTAPLSYSVSPSLPAGLNLSSATGAITGTPTVASAAANYTVTVTDANSATATASFSLTVNSAVTATQAVASATLTQNHAATAFTPVTGSGGTAPLSYSVSPSLPAGLSMSSTTGTITGTPTVASASTNYTVTVTDANGATATASFSLTVNAVVTATQTIASATLTQNHAATSFTPVTGSGGITPLSYSVSPSLPAGLSMGSATGAITGTPTVASAAANYTVTVTDANSATATASFSLTVNAAVTATQTIASATLTQNHAATSFTPVTGSGGITPLSYSVSPSLPAGLNLSSATGAITGTPTVASAAANYTVTVTDANSATATASFSLTVNSAVMATVSVASAILTQSHAATAFTPVIGSGGTGTLSYTVLPSLPAGLNISSTTGAITGTPTVASAAANYTVTITDANSATATTSFSLTVNPAVTATVSVASTVLTLNQAATSFTPVTGSGGTSPLSYSVSPSLPAGLNLSSATGEISGTPTAASAVASYTVTVTDANNATVTASFSLAVGKTMPTVTTWPTANAITYGQTLADSTLTGGAASVSGTFDFTSPTIAPSEGTAAQSVTFAPADTTNYNTTAGTVSVTVNPATLNVTINHQSITYGGAIPALTGVLTGVVNNDNITASYTTTATAISPAGAYPITATLNDPGNRLGNYTVTNTPGVLTIDKAAGPQVMLTSSGSPLLFQSPVTLTATLTSPVGVPAGSVSFLDGTTVLGTGALTNGVATLTTSTLTVGVHDLSATYEGDRNFLPSSSAPVVQTEIDYTITSTGSTTKTVMPGQSASFTYTVAPSPNTTLPAAAVLTVTGLPTGSTATLSGSAWTQLTHTSWQLSANTAPGTLTLTIATPDATASNSKGSCFSRRMAPLALSLLPFFFAGCLRRAGKRLGHYGMLLLFLGAGLLATLGLSGCGAGAGFFSQTQRSYTVTVTLMVGSLSHSTNVNLTVE